MKLSDELNSALNEQVLKEFHNSSLYVQIWSYFEDLQLPRLSDYFKKRSDEEKSHANKFIQYINDRNGGKVTIGEIDAPVLGNTVENIADSFVLAEEETTESIEALYDLALSEKSYIDLGFLQEMLNEQVSEEDEALKFATRIKNVKDIVLFDATFEG